MTEASLSCVAFINTSTWMADDAFGLEHSPGTRLVQGNLAGDVFQALAFAVAAKYRNLNFGWWYPSTGVM